MLIAIDGPAASGKGTLGKRIAGHLGLAHLDTGLLYRAVGAACLAIGKLDDEAASVAAAHALDVSTLDPETLRTGEIGEAASVVAARPEVRAALIDLQRRFAARPEGAVLDGRDIGTVICPDATVKLFVTATPEVRAERRYKELSARDPFASYEAVLADIHKRDARDSNRAAAPLLKADDAVLLDTSALGIEESFAAALAIVERARG
ncbi:cytidylate kinase [Azorhizobium oxalatiphilum]|uniref:Cytidylate kinase n=1 Tax=Azorhizobium oxalatiphilum TaxID=980631 RepID=A0A917F5R4_9HYPH|nr:(d)CMP kinase [Azorhizobium oxalatiphilum]GGF46177.1 cytidylate kinase [Azorhizobium oxalatiphilum]